jgi:gliding motility-associated-like protein
LTRTAVTLTINAAPVAPTSGGDQTVCTDGTNTQTLTATATGGTITWYDAATAGNVVQTPTQMGVGTSTYYAQASNGTCSSLTRTAVVLTINTAPDGPTSGGNQTVCTDGTITQTLTATATGGTITWYDAAVDGTEVTSPTQVGVGTKTYYAEAYNGICSSLTRTAVTLTINAAPDAPTSSGNQTVCTDGTTRQTLTATATGGTITWYDAAVDGEVVTTPSQIGVGTKTYYAQASNETCSSLTRTAVVLTINPAPVAPTSGGDQTECQSTTIQTLTATAIGGTITWYTEATGGNIVESPTLSSVGTITYYAQADNGNCSSLTRTAVTLTINPTLVLTASTKIDAACNGTNTGSITAGTVTNAVGTVTYSWKNSENAIIGTSATVNNVPAGIYTLTVSDQCTSKSNSVTVGQPIMVTVSGIATNVACYGEANGSITITNSIGSTVVITNAANEIVSNSNLVAGTYTLTASASNSSQIGTCTAVAQVVISQPVKIEPIETESICNTDRTLIIDLNSYLPVGTPLTGNWIDDGSNALNKNILTPYNLSIRQYDFQYQVTVDGCPLTYIIKMNITDFDCGIVLGCGVVEVHNAFSPNGDGINEMFVIDNIEDTVCYPENTVEIYNRWGVLVFETKNYNNETNSFKGYSQGRTTVSQSSGLPTGTYFYILNYLSVDGTGNIQTNKKDGFLYLTR